VWGGGVVGVCVGGGGGGGGGGVWNPPTRDLDVYIDSRVSLVEERCTYRRVQPIPLGVTFSNAVSKLKAQSSNVSFH